MWRKEIGASWSGKFHKLQMYQLCLFRKLLPNKDYLVQCQSNSRHLSRRWIRAKTRQKVSDFYNIALHLQLWIGLEILFPPSVVKHVIQSSDQLCKQEVQRDSIVKWHWPERMSPAAVGRYQKYHSIHTTEKEKHVLNSWRISSSCPSIHASSHRVLSFLKIVLRDTVLPAR